MSDQLSESLSKRFEEYKYFRKVGAHHSAVTRLAEIYHCLPRLDKSDRTKWSEIIQQETPSDDILQAAKTGVKEDAQRIRQILAYGAVWNDDELLLVLTLRIEIDLVLSFLNEYWSSQLTVPTRDIDEQIVSVSKTAENKHAFEVAINLMNKNWGLPIDSRWLRKDLSIQG